MKTIVEGFVCETKHRKCDHNKNPIEDWNNFYYNSCSGSGINPYVYTTQHKALQSTRNIHNYVPIYDESDKPTSPYNFRYGTPEHEKASSEWKNWINSRSIIAYIEHLSTAIPAKIVIEDE